MPPRTWVTWALQGSFCLPRTHYIYPPLLDLHYLSSFRSTVAAAYHALPPQPVALFIPHVATHPSLHISGRILPFSLSYIGRSMLTPPTLVKSSHMFVRFASHYALTNLDHLKSLGPVRSAFEPLYRTLSLLHRHSRMSSHLSYPSPQPDPSTSTSIPQPPPQRELLKNCLYVGNLHPTVDECVPLSTADRLIMIPFLPQIHPHPSLLQVWKTRATRLSLS